MTEEDISMIDHFWNNKGDLEMWVDWEEKQKVVPIDLVSAWDDYLLAKEDLQKVIDKVITGELKIEKTIECYCHRYYQQINCPTHGIPKVTS